MPRCCSLFVMIAAPALACPWDYETYAAEWAALPCLAPVAAGVLPGHSMTLWKQKLDVADFELAFAPGSVQSLDLRTVALIHLGRIPEAVQSARRRLALTPTAYEAHANLGTALTFSGDLEESLREIDAALELKPDAHFGREVVHRRFVEYLLKGRNEPSLFLQQDFLGHHITVERIDALEKSEKPAGDEALAALRAVVAMIAVYGAKDVSHLWLALGDLALEARLPRTAWAAWERARTLRHPRAKELQLLQARLERTLKANWVPSPMIAELLSQNRLHEAEGGWAGMQRSDERERQQYKARWNEYEKTERRLVKAGTPFWNEGGAATLFAEQVKLGLRCEQRQDAPPASPADEELRAPVAVLSGLDLSKPCADVARALDQSVTREKQSLAGSATAVVLSRTALEPLARARARCGSTLDLVLQHARTATTGP